MLHWQRGRLHTHNGKEEDSTHIGKEEGSTHIGKEEGSTHIGKKEYFIHIGKEEDFIHIGKEEYFIHIDKEEDLHSVHNAYQRRTWNQNVIQWPPCYVTPLLSNSSCCQILKDWH